MTELIERAQQFAEIAHAKQVRKYTNEPYVNHCIEVMQIVRTTLHHTEEMLAAALLHDTVEDTGTPLKTIEEEFGPKVASLVEQLTDVSTHADGNRKARKAKDLAHTALASPEAQTIKLADLISNTKSIVAFDPAFAKVYLAEKELVLNVLDKGDFFLMHVARGLLNSGQSLMMLYDRMKK